MSQLEYYLYFWLKDPETSHTRYELQDDASFANLVMLMQVQVGKGRFT